MMRSKEEVGVPLLESANTDTFMNGAREDYKKVLLVKFKEASLKFAKSI